MCVRASICPVPPRVCARSATRGSSPVSLLCPTPLFKPASHSDQLAKTWRRNTYPPNQRRDRKMVTDLGDDDQRNRPIKKLISVRLGRDVRGITNDVASAHGRRFLPGPIRCREYYVWSIRKFLQQDRWNYNYRRGLGPLEKNKKEFWL